MRNGRAPLLLLLFWLLATVGWWAFAFIPVSAATPEWFTAAQNACFGTLPNGLPDTYGWMVLILGPASLFLGLLVTWYDELKDGIRGLWQLGQGRAALLLLTALSIGVGILVSGRIRQGIEISRLSFASNETGELPADYPRTQKDPVDFSLVNQHGDTIKLSSLKGKVVVLTFAFAHCTTVCPLLVQQAITAVGRKETAGLENYQILIVTLDPWRDTPGSLPMLAQQWNLPSNAWVLSGKVPDVEHTIQSFGVPYERNLNTGDVVHPALTFLLDTEGKVAYTFNNAPPAWLRAAADRLLAPEQAKEPKEI